jgi:hypothetical protein
LEVLLQEQEQSWSNLVRSGSCVDPYADPYSDPATQNNADSSGSESATLLLYLKYCVLCPGVGPGEQQQLMMGQMSQLQQRSHQASTLTYRLCKSTNNNRKRTNVVNPKLSFRVYIRVQNDFPGYGQKFRIRIHNTGTFEL